jgi:hypothetical protein
MKEYVFDEGVKRLRFFTRLDDITWFVQSKKDSIMESFYVSVVPGAIVMYGDYDGVIVRPGCSSVDGHIRWMSNATDLMYFCEKVGHGNRYHVVEEFSSKKAEGYALREIISKYDLGEEVEDLLLDAKKRKTSFEDDDFEVRFDDLVALSVNCHPTTVETTYEDYGSLKGMVIDFFGTDFDSLEDYFDFCERNKVSDYTESVPMEYHHQIKWQHECLLWWAKNLVDEEFREKNNIESFDKRVPVELRDSREVTPEVYATLKKTYSEPDNGGFSAEEFDGFFKISQELMAQARHNNHDESLMVWLKVLKKRWVEEATKEVSK